MEIYFLKKIVNFIEAVSIKIGKISAWLIFVVIVAVAVEIVMRYVFENPTMWSIEVSLFSCSIMYFFGAAWTLQQGKHVKIDIIYGRLNKRKRALLDCVTFIFFVVFMAMFIWAGFRFAGKAIAIWENSGSSWDPPIWPLKLSVPIAVVLLFLQGAAKFIKDIHLAITGREL